MLSFNTSLGTLHMLMNMNIRSYLIPLIKDISSHIKERSRRDVPVGVPLDLSTPTGISCIGTYGENCKSDNVSKYRVLLVVFLLLWHGN